MLPDAVKIFYDVLTVNEEAIAKNVRYLTHDMNRTAPGVSDSPIYELRRWAEIQNIIQKYDLVIDIHGTQSDCGICSIFPRWWDFHKKLLQFLPWKNHVIWETDLQKSGPITQFHNFGFEIEVGPISEENIILLSHYLSYMINEFESTEQIKYDNSVYKVVGKASHQEHIPERDFEIMDVQGVKYVSFLTKNKYKEDIGCILLQKIQPNDRF